MSRYRPVLVIPRTTQALVLDVIAIAGLVATLAIAVRAWSVLPDIIPVHFGLDGRPNVWGSKSIVWMLPVLGLLNYIALSVLVRFPHTFNYAVRITEQNALRQYQIVCAMLNWLKAEFANPFNSLSQIHLPPEAGNNRATIFENVNFHLVASPIDLILEGRIEDMHLLVARGDGRINRQRSRHDAI